MDGWAWVPRTVPLGISPGSVSTQRALNFLKFMISQEGNAEKSSGSFTFRIFFCLLFCMEEVGVQPQPAAGA